MIASPLRGGSCDRREGLGHGEVFSPGLRRSVHVIPVPTGPLHAALARVCF